MQMHKISSTEFEGSPCLAKTIGVFSNFTCQHYNCFAYCDGSIENCIAASKPFCGEGVPGPNLIEIFNKFLCDKWSLSKHKFGVYADILYQFGSFLNNQWGCINCKCWALNVRILEPELKAVNAYTLTHGLDCLKHADSFCKGLIHPKTQR